MPVHKEWAFVSLSRRLTLPREGCNRIDPSRWYFKDVLLKIFAALTIAGSSAFAVLHSFFLNWGSWCSSSWLSSSKHFLSLVYNFLSLCKLHNSQRFLNINFDFPSTLYIVENSALSANVQSSCALSTFPYSPSGSWSPPCCAGSRARMGAQGGLRIPSHQTVSYRGMSTNWDGCCHKIAQWYGYHPMNLGANSFVWNPIPAQNCVFFCTSNWSWMKTQSNMMLARRPGHPVLPNPQIPFPSGLPGTCGAFCSLLGQFQHEEWGTLSPTKEDNPCSGS